MQLEGGSGILRALSYCYYGYAAVAALAGASFGPHYNQCAYFLHCELLDVLSYLSVQCGPQAHPRVHCLLKYRPRRYLSVQYGHRSRGISG